jgi:hypothetical protein
MKKIWKDIFLLILILAVLTGCKKVEKQTDATLEEILRSSKEFVTVKETKIASLAGPTGTAGQGGYTDGKYYYQAFIKRDKVSNEAENEVYIIKYDLEKGVKIQQSGPFKLNHANDITYNPKLGYFVVCHNNPNRYNVTYIDAETLEYVETIQLDYMIYSIDYNETQDRYVVGIAGGQNYRILDGNFKDVGTMGEYISTNRTTGYVTQGVSCDDNFIYFILYRKNVIAVYDWDGLFVSIIELQNTGEPENISVTDDKIYFGAWESDQRISVYMIEGLREKQE